MKKPSSTDIFIKDYESTRFLVCPIDNTYLLWVEKSRKFLLIEEPALKVIELLLQKKELKEIASRLASDYELSNGECLSFAEEVTNRFSDLMVETPSQTSISVRRSEVLIPPANFTRIYEFHNQKRLKISFQSHQLQDLINPLFSHLETQENKKPDFSIHLFENENSLCMDTESDSVEQWSKNDVPHFKGELFGQILNLVYSKTNNDWMATMHASAIANGDSAILFSAKAGAGKSTIATLLQAKGFDLLTDDFVAVDLSFNAYRFEMATALKEGSLSLFSKSYPSLLDQTPHFLSNGKKGVYLPPISKEKTKSCFPIICVIFIDFNPEHECSMFPISKVEAIQRLLLEVYVTPTMDCVTQFIRFVESTTFLTLSYSNNDLAIKQIENIFRK